MRDRIDLDKSLSKSPDKSPKKTSPQKPRANQNSRELAHIEKVEKFASQIKSDRVVTGQAVPQSLQREVSPAASNKEEQKVLAEGINYGTKSTERNSVELLSRETSKSPKGPVQAQPLGQISAEHTIPSSYTRQRAKERKAADSSSNSPKARKLTISDLEE